MASGYISVQHVPRESLRASRSAARFPESAICHIEDYRHRGLAGERCCPAKVVTNSSRGCTERNSYMGRMGYVKEHIGAPPKKGASSPLNLRPQTDSAQTPKPSQNTQPARLLPNISPLANLFLCFNHTGPSQLAPFEKTRHIHTRQCFFLGGGGGRSFSMCRGTHAYDQHLE